MNVPLQTRVRDMDFQVARGWRESQLAWRIHEIVSGHTPGFEPFQKHNGSWVLDSGNDWWLHRVALETPEAPATWCLTYRYGRPTEVWTALRVLFRLVGIMEEGLS